MEKNRIYRIQVKNLFDGISYDIDLSENKPVSIITAPNGRGKTTILNLISFLFNPDFETFNVIRTIPFDEFKCYLSNGMIVALKQFKKEADEAAGEKEKNIRTTKDRWKKSVLEIFEKVDFEFNISNIDGVFHSIPFYSTLMEAFSVEMTEFLDEVDRSSLLYYRMRYDVSLPLKYLWKKQNQYLEEDNCNISVKFIKADRIQPVLLPRDNMRDNDDMRQESPLKIASKEISNKIIEAIEEYNEAVSQAKDKLPQMFLDGEGSRLSADNFIDGWTVYRNELNQFQEIGLITSTEDFTKGKDITQFYQEKGSFLSTYLSAFKETTAPLRNIYAKLNLLKQIIDNRNRITGKVIKFGKQGITLLSNDRVLSLETLSSGEKHDLIMFYDLIFNIKEHGLVLVDEPEISLHIEWQETYLDRLIEICEMNDLQAIVATHSPNIVSSHYDLLVDKGEING